MALRTAHTPQQLAYLGDAVWSLHVRCKYLSPPKVFASYRGAAERHTSAARQSAYLDCLLSSGWQLSPAEAELLGWSQRVQGGGAGGGAAAGAAVAAPNSAAADGNVGGGGEGPDGAGGPGGGTEAAAGGRAAGVCGRAGPGRRGGRGGRGRGLAAAGTGDGRLKFRGRFTSAGGQQDAYRRATAFEAVLGHLSLSDPPRLQQLLTALEPHMEQVDGGEEGRQ
ncbi:hypothetical protein CHLRE_07g354800v5 [Chlamydomonas reinhardtii]|uniref:RNase III domain-containing protein n=1 Tax=Chlamydomonas reinhardtii TaxID=3055 RepID=A0A2K3DLK5_CHLRE|nr:uncharacterized protein CHLRE_07g354800v5 [Chlamydomonas reinhardtii]PNW81410.1 hypothetical protein CHLRE_07g354800v5 [Chlamydomonas reinhardtii]